MNKARCKNCNTIIESTYRHDWVACKCFKNEVDNKGIFIDGGNDYKRYGGCIKNIEWLDQDVSKNNQK